MKRFLSSILILTLFSAKLMSQSTWSNVYPDILSAGLGTVAEVIECPNGDFICVGGNGDKYGTADAFMMRIHSNGDQVWYKEYSDFHSFASVMRLESGELVAGGLVSSSSNISCILKTDSLGNVIKAVEVEVDSFGNAKSIIKSPNGFIATASFTWELNNAMTDLNWIARLQPNGGTNDIEAVPGGFITLGTGGLVSGSGDIHLTKIDAIGNQIWSMCHGGQRGERAMDLETTMDGGFLIGGWTDSFEGWNRKYFMVKTDSVGNYEWGKTYNDSIYGNFGHCVLEDDAGNFYIGGIHQSDNVMIIKTDPTGNLIWSKTFNSGTAYSMIQASDGNIVVAGETRAFEYFVFKMDTSGNSICSENVVIDEFDRPFESEISYGAGGIVNEVTEVGLSGATATKLHVSCEFLGIDESSGIKKRESIQVYPNPASDFVQFTFAAFSQNRAIKIYTSQGQLIQTVEIEKGSQFKTLSLEKFSNGIYIYSLENQQGVFDHGRLMINR